MLVEMLWRGISDLQLSRKSLSCWEWPMNIINISKSDPLNRFFKKQVTPL